MKVVYPVCCGVDVHKSFFIATIISTTSDIQPNYSRKRFSTFNNDIIRFADWLSLNNCNDVCMESTGKYWIPVFNILESKNINVTIANPKWVKAVKGNKDDKKDSKWIGDLFRLGLVPGSFIPSKPIRVLREFTRYRYKLVSMKSSEKNRFQNAFTVCNIGLESIEGYQITKEQKLRMNTVRSHLTYIENSIKYLDDTIDSMVTPYESLIALMCTIPGIERKSAITVISEIGNDVSLFGSSKRLCSWAGLTPGSNESAGKKKSVRISWAGVYLKPALVEIAHCAVKSTKSPYYKSKYEKLVKRRGKERAIIAIVRMILTAIYNMLSTGEVWNPCDLFKLDMPDKLKAKQEEKAVKQAVKFLEKRGYLVS